MKVSEILKFKGNVLFTVTPSTPILQAVNIMAEKDMGSLVVMEGGKLVGILTFQEIMDILHAHKGSIGEGTVREHMNSNPVTISPDTDINEARRLMLERHPKHGHPRYVPVVSGSVVLGVISFYDVAKAVFESQSFENKMLKSYIQDWPAQSE
ncbi:CBS domain-containing protein [Oxalobacteraceae bacterium R-40]|uniref:CBS domain-containing protein n=1 Tax=Keguizhuia sedimenti TaxID=3064264 RepID=A0ABU1BMM1_9BURK|nr:CBS domain-containing protein [Oxalobacteraceae bacterium R-40]